MWFREATALGQEDIAVVQRAVRKRVLRLFERRGLLAPRGGFSLDAAVRIEALDRKGLESQDGRTSPGVRHRAVEPEAYGLFLHEIRRHPRTRTQGITTFMHTSVGMWPTFAEDQVLCSAYWLGNTPGVKSMQQESEIETTKTGPQDH